MHDESHARRVWTALDAALLATAAIWGANYSVIKVVLRKMPPLAFSCLRVSIACIVFLLAIAVSAGLRRRAGRLEAQGRHGEGLHARMVRLAPGGHANLSMLRTAPLSARDWWLVALLGLIGHFAYQVTFIEGLTRTSVANASLIVACTPIFVGLMSAAVGQERLGPPHWMGAALSFTGVYLVIGGGAALGTSLMGDLLVVASSVCWAVYTLLGRVLLRRHSPLVVTGYSMAMGTLLFVPYSAAALARTPWSTLDGVDWASIGFSALLAMNVGYILWYAGVQRLGSARTAVYANLVPIAALIVATAWLGERLGWMKAIGATAVIAGLGLTRLRVGTPPRE